MTTTGTTDDSLRNAGSTVAALATSELLGKAATLVMFVVLARLLGLAEFGVFSLGLGLGLLLAVLSSVGLDARVVQLGSARPETLDRCYGAIVVIRAVISTAICAVALPVLLAVMDGPDAAAVMLVLVSCLLDTFSDASRACCGARQVQHLTAVVLVAQRFTTLALVVGALLIEPSAWFAAVAYLLGTSSGVVGMHLAARRAGVRLQVSGSRAEARSILAATPVMGLNAFASMGLFRIDTALVGVMLGTTAVGIYSANYRIFETIIFVSWSLSRVFVPVVASDADDAAHVRAWSQRSMMVMLAIYVPYGVVLALRGDDIVALLLGAEYVDPGVLVALAAAPLLFGIAHLSASVLLAIRPDPVVLLASVVALVVNIGLNLVLIPTVGIIGAAVSTTLSFLLQAVILVAALRRRTGPLMPPSRLVGITAGSLAAAAGCALVAPLVPALVVAGCLYVAVGVLVTRVVDPSLAAEVGALVRHRSDRGTRGVVRDQRS